MNIEEQYQSFVNSLRGKILELWNGGDKEGARELFHHYIPEVGHAFMKELEESELARVRRSKEHRATRLTIAAALLAGSRGTMTIEQSVERAERLMDFNNQY